MIKSSLSVCFSACLLLQAQVVFCQSRGAESTPVDSRVAQLVKQDPASLVSEATYEHKWPLLRESNISWKMRIWRDVDTRVESNHRMADIGAGHSSLAAVLIKGAIDGVYKAYTPADDRFTHELSGDALKAQLHNDAVTPAAFNPALITRYRLKEDWLYITSEHKLVCGIIGIAPLRTVVAADGVTTDEPMFWLYYSGVRQYLREQHVSAIPGGKARNLDELFELREYAGDIWKVNSYSSPTPEQRAQTLKVEAMLDQQRKVAEDK